MAQHQQQQQERRGIVRKWLANQGYGFLTADDDGSDLFFHRTALPNSADEPVPGDRVAFVDGVNPRTGRALATNPDRRISGPPPADCGSSRDGPSRQRGGQSTERLPLRIIRFLVVALEESGPPRRHLCEGQQNGPNRQPVSTPTGGCGAA